MGWPGWGRCCARRIRSRRSSPATARSRASPYAGRVRHVALLPEGGTLHVFFSAIGDAPEEILHTTIALEGDWRQWRIGAVDKVLQPEARYECTELPNVRSEVGEIDRPARQLRDPAVIRDGGPDLSLLHVLRRAGHRRRRDPLVDRRGREPAAGPPRAAGILGRCLYTGSRRRSPTRCGATSRSSPTSITARPRSSTRCSGRAASSAPTSRSPTA